VEIPDKDIGSKSDPFIIVNLGGKEISVLFVLSSLRINIWKIMMNHSLILRLWKIWTFLKIAILKYRYGTMILWEVI